jgi:hypothetical protein
VTPDQVDTKEVAVTKTLGIDANMLDERKINAIKGLFSQFASLPVGNLDKIKLLSCDQTQQKTYRTNFYKKGRRMIAPQGQTR